MSANGTASIPDEKPKADGCSTSTFSSDEAGSQAEGERPAAPALKNKQHGGSGDAASEPQMQADTSYRIRDGAAGDSELTASVTFAEPNEILQSAFVVAMANGAQIMGVVARLCHSLMYYSLGMMMLSITSACSGVRIGRSPAMAVT